jgi:hypothetical protein
LEPLAKVVTDWLGGVAYAVLDSCTGVPWIDPEEATTEGMPKELGAELEAEGYGADDESRWRRRKNKSTNELVFV